MTEFESRRKLVQICRLLYERELIVANAGNVSVRLELDRFLATPSGVCKGFIEPRDLVVVDGVGRRLAGFRDVSSEFDMHRVIYEVRPDIGAVVHAHPALATAFTVAGRALAAPILTEGLLTVGHISTAPYATPGTPGVGEGLRELISRHDAVLLAHHGAVCCGKDLDTAYWYMEIVEHTARTQLAAEVLGGARSLPAPEIDHLLAQRRLAQRPLLVSRTGG